MAVVHFVSGPIGSGKTTRLEAWFRQAPPGTVGGILARKWWRAGQPAGYDLVLVPGWTVCPLAGLSVDEASDAWRDSFAFGPFRFRKAAFEAAAAHLEALAADPRIDTLLIDEIGPMELAGGGHAGILDRLLRTDKELMLCVRSECLDAVRQRVQRPGVLMSDACPIP